MKNLIVFVALAVGLAVFGALCGSVYAAVAGPIVGWLFLAKTRRPVLSIVSLPEA